MSAHTWRDLTARQLATAASRRVLLIEDDDHYVERARQTLIAAAPEAFSLEVAPTMAAAISALTAKRYDVVLLDLGLPDEHGVRTFERVQQVAPRIPIIIMTSADEPEMAAYTLYLGAADYLIKNASDDLLLHVISRSISRFRPHAGAFDMDLPESDSARPLRVTQPEIFEELTADYSNIVDIAIRSNYAKVVGEGHRSPLRVLATQLGRANAAARDALEIHKHAVERRLQNPAVDLEMWVGEARIVALELMALLADHYRTIAQPH